MLSIRDLLNPTEPATTMAEDAQVPSPRQADVILNPRPLATDSQRHQFVGKPSTELQRSRESSGAMMSSVNFAPFEEVGEEAVREIRKYRIPQFGSIYRSWERIPYNSSKRDFSTKTGRECIQAFKYTFQRPGQTTAYTVMWDYNIGIVRITPFFKALGYTNKTKPSQVLDKNPGLREVCSSITGGAVQAQGYWMPFHCAKALCATFCYTISGALIPIFGPDFPSKCTSPTSRHFGDMLINPRLIIDASRRTNSTRRVFSGEHNTPIVSSDPPNLVPDTPQPASVSAMIFPTRQSLDAARREPGVAGGRKRSRSTFDQDGSIHSRSWAAPAAGHTSIDQLTRLSSRTVTEPYINGSPKHGLSIDRYSEVSERHKRRRAAIETYSIAAMEDFDDLGQCERRALPGGRGPVSLRRLDTEGDIDETESTKPAASTLVQIGNAPLGE